MQGGGTQGGGPRGGGTKGGGSKKGGLKLRPGYLAFGLAVLGLLALAEYRGWGLSPAREARAVPQSVRDNPGAYRPIYYGSGRYLGGK